MLLNQIEQYKKAILDSLNDGRIDVYNEEKQEAGEVNNYFLSPKMALPIRTIVLPSLRAIL